MKKSQLIGQPLIFIFIAIVSALILIFGAYQALKIQEMWELAQVNKELGRIERNMQQIYDLSSGTSKKYTYLFPKHIKNLCILSNDPNPGSSTSLGTGDGLFPKEVNYVNEIRDNAQGLYLFSYEKNPVFLSIDITPSNTACFTPDHSGKISLIIKNEGTKISLTSSIQ